jgi:phenylalanyl-tRNA synthetase beta chain
VNVSLRWLRSIAPSIPADPHGVAERLGMLGAPVDEIVALDAGIGDVRIARVTEVRQHPNADRLRVCTVEAGGAEPLQVVCGAPNVEPGGWYPFAPVGARLPGGVQIRKAKLRGEVSEGMLCSARELGLGRDHEGLMTLQGEWEPGSAFVESLGLDDARLVLDVTPNRPDLLSQLGVARELAAEGAATLALPPFPGSTPFDLPVSRGEREGEVAGVRVRIEDPDACPRYLGAVIRGLRVAPSPEWLATRLRAVGVRPINNVVDATNYVLFETGQPLHAFDRARLRGDRVTVRHARAGEGLRTLDATERTLRMDALVIADAQGPIALAGVMGGEESEVSAATSEVFLECAIFASAAVRRTARQLGLATDASFRFERGVDREGTAAALRRAVELIVAVAGGEPAGAVDLAPTEWAPRTVELRPARVERLLGVELPLEELEALLRPIGFAMERADGTLRVRVPGFRPDVTGEIDLVEEIARRRGYDSFADELGPFRPSQVPEDALVAVQRRVRERLLAWGFAEARTAAFAPEREGRVPLLNPLSSEESHLRDALAPGLMRRVEYNVARGVRDVRLFEVGTVFAPAPGGGVVEQPRVAAVFCGARQPAHWSAPAPAWDVWDLKALLEQLAEMLPEAAVEPGSWEPLAALVAAAESLHVTSPRGVRGGGGRAAPAVLDLPSGAEAVWLLEAVLPEGKTAAIRPFRAIPAHPGMERDLALLVPDDVTVAEVRATVESSCGASLESAGVFDVYAGPGIPHGMRGVGWRLRFRAEGRTLTDAEVDGVIDAVLRALEQRHGVRLR